ncbi:hypothetical protein BUALT_Bualt04G0147200 [Buddleja alternifolia]|uniref:Glutaredoxin domain-containing protein n=1 Tax=Buddleja alternifolia TaxID=168488 RepID=A0AAV6XNZ2_9LAMI|nr:hypothetical protein BUALT_Bualt04G0147200 [Buddleja alternifolia]
MGCASSKQKVCRNCQGPYSPMGRSFSMHVHHPPQKTGDSYHLVALTSSTLGSLRLDPSYHNFEDEDDKGKGKAPLNQNSSDIEDGDIDKEKASKEEFAMGMIEAKTWSKMIKEKIPKVAPKTPIRTPPGEPETINAWEMMEGLEDLSPNRPVHHFRSFSFHVARNPSLASIDDQPTPRVKENGNASPKPLWLDVADSDSNSNSNDTSIVSEFDPDVIATFRRALEELPPANPFHLRPLDADKQSALGGKDCALEVMDGKNVNNTISVNKISQIAPRGTDKLIVYFTSLRGVRKTYEDCCHVRVILKGLGVKIDERDVSMHSGFKEELKELLGEGFGAGGLPRVFLGKKCVGGAEEIRRLNEDGKLEKMVESCELVDDDGGGGGVRNCKICEACGDIRFVPCETCSGSCKIYYEGDYDEEEFNESEHEYGFHRCPDCNENGLIRCPICCD